MTITRRTAIGNRYIIHTFHASRWPRETVLVVDTYTARRRSYYIWLN